MSPVEVSEPPAVDLARTGAAGRDEARARRVRAVIPCYNRPADLEALLADLAALDPARARLDVTVVDNASTPPLRPRVPVGLDARIVRLKTNTGGAGGFNAGLEMLLADDAHDHDLLWLIDSDARLDRAALVHLLAALDNDPRAVAAGSALADPDTREVFEVGGRIEPRTGEYVQPRWWRGPDDLVHAEYLAACSLLVRASAARRAGLMPDVFISGDDVEWTIRLARDGLGDGPGRLLAAPRSIAYHPRPDRMRTWARYYAARNAFAALDTAGAPARTRLARGLRETARALTQVLVARTDLGELHVRGLEHAAAGTRRGAAPPGSLDHEPYRQGDSAAPPPAREPALRAALRAIRRLALGLPRGECVVSARARPGDWLPAQRIVTAWERGSVARDADRHALIADLADLAGRGVAASVALALNPAPDSVPVVPAPERGSESGERWAPPEAPTIAAIVVSYNRWAALERTLAALADLLPRARVVVVDNASHDSSPARIRDRFPAVELVELGSNVGIEAFNIGAARAREDLLLILDDDAIPDRAALEGATDLLAHRPDLAAVALHPRHPATGRTEWPFAADLAPGPTFPIMGCGNLVRRADWERLRGYEGGYFLYRNDTDMALLLGAIGRGVWFDPAWIVWHDSPAAARKSRRWCRFATRNWIWMARRHGRGLHAHAGALLGWAWAHRLAGLDPVRHLAVLRGVLEGLTAPPPPLPPGVRPGGDAYARLLALRFARRRARDTHVRS